MRLLQLLAAIGLLALLAGVAELVDYYRVGHLPQAALGAAPCTP